MGIFFKRETSGPASLMLSRSLDVIVLVFVLFLIITSYYSLSDKDKKDAASSTTIQFRDYLNDGSSIVSLSLFILVFYVVVYLFRIPMTSDTKPLTVSLIESVSWFLFLILFIIDFFKYILGISLVPYLFGTGEIKWWNNLRDTKDASNNKVDVSNNKVDVSNNIVKKEVFNISNNLYTYDDAQAICSSYDAELATSDQVEDAYNKGGEWCNYGWSANQLALFPTQKATWSKLQQTDKHKNDCGRPGVNGGYIANPNVNFGVNCYGVKPKASSNDLARLSSTSTGSNKQKSSEDVLLETKIEFWKKNADQLMVINPHNQTKWTAY
jgi:hypothetical protein